MAFPAFVIRRVLESHLHWFAEEAIKSLPTPENKVVIVIGDAAFAAKDNMKLIQARDKDESHRRWGFVFAIARIWNMAYGKSLRNLVKHTPHSCYRQTWIPRLPDHKGRKTFWISEKLTSLKHLGDVTVVLTKKGRNVGPQNTKLLVTNLLELTGRQVIDIYQRRWAIEILFKELKSGLGLGEHVLHELLPTS